jgi:alpha-amylase
MNRFLLFIISFLSIALFLSSCSHAPRTHVVHPSWTQDAVIYEVNLRQFTQEGTLAAFDNHLDRLAGLGVDILWFMPLHPIGVVERKGELGSYYSVMDYKGINPEFGTLEDFKKTVKSAHDRGMKVILDWVANHTSRDHSWITEHPEWYVKDSLGAILAPFDWSDVAQLDLDNKEMRSAMLDAMKFWVQECGVDGYRCDVAWNVPVDMWNYLFSELRKVRSDLFFLAEAEKEELNVEAFDAYYGWEMHHIMNKLAKGEASAEDLVSYIHSHSRKFSPKSIQLNFTSNHDENSWAGSEYERMGDAVKQFAALTFAFPGMPLIYSGQETGLSRRLEFFKRDPIEWNDSLNMTQFYSELIQMRDAHKAMYAPTSGGDLNILKTDKPKEIFAFERKKDEDHFVALFNFSDKDITFKYREGEDSLPAHGYKFIF